MQLVLCKNRVVAHGENFLSMGGTVINTETNRVYQNATIAECDNCPSDVDKVGYEYHAGVFVPCAPYGKGNGNIMVACQVDCGTPKDSGIPLNHIDAIASYFAFVGNINTDMVDAAFGKNNEDNIKGVGRALAMYAWYKGTDKVEKPFTNLIEMSSLSDMDINSFEEIVMDSYLRALIKVSPYAASMFKFDSDSLTTSGNGEKTYNITVSEEDLTRPFYIYTYLYAYRMSGSVSLTIGTKTYEITCLSNLTERHQLEEFIDWSDVGITSAGTYTITMKSSSSVTGSSVDGNASFSIIRMKG